MGLVVILGAIMVVDTAVHVQAGIWDRMDLARLSLLRYMLDTQDCLSTDLIECIR